MRRGFKLTADGTESILYDFDTGKGGYEPTDGPPIIDRQGNLYGTTWYGGANGAGTIFMIRN